MTDINNKHKTYNVASQLTTSVNDFIFVSEYDTFYLTIISCLHKKNCLILKGLKECAHVKAVKLLEDEASKVPF